MMMSQELLCKMPSKPCLPLRRRQQQPQQLRLMPPECCMHPEQLFTCTHEQYAVADGIWNVVVPVHHLPKLVCSHKG